MKKKMDSNIIEDKSAKVACLTTDFAMQNVLKQIGLKLASLDGKIIKQMRTYIFRCYGCFKTTSIMTSVFCPNCGNKTLKKVAVSIDKDGNRTIHINFKKPISSRGKRVKSSKSLNPFTIQMKISLDFFSSLCPCQKEENTRTILYSAWINRYLVKDQRDWPERKPMPWTTII